jgi:hypothetical protein
LGFDADFGLELLGLSFAALLGVAFLADFFAGILLVAWLVVGLCAGGEGKACAGSEKIARKSRRSALGPPRGLAPPRVQRLMQWGGCSRGRLGSV